MRTGRYRLRAAGFSYRVPDKSEVIITTLCFQQADKHGSQRMNRDTQMYSKAIGCVASREASATTAAKKWLRSFALALALALLLPAIIKFQPRATMITARVVAPVTESMPLPQAPRRIYPYSVIPGGAYNAAELRTAAQNEPLIREHYRDFKLDQARLVVLRQNRQQYVSYRMAGQIFWTKKRLLIPKGAILLTDGSHYARTRCGNRLSDTPQKETSGVEPAPAALNSDPSGTELVQTLQSHEPAHAASHAGQTSHPPDEHELSPVAPVEDAPASSLRGDGPAPQVGPVSLLSSSAYINTPALTPVIQPRGQGSPVIPGGVLLPTPAEPPIVPEPGTLYLFGVTGIVSLGALLWLGRTRRQ